MDDDATMEIEREYGEDPHWEEIDPAEVIKIQ
jgi:hypothetical protein